MKASATDLQTLMKMVFDKSPPWQLAAGLIETRPDLDRDDWGKVFRKVAEEQTTYRRVPTHSEVMTHCPPRNLYCRVCDNKRGIEVVSFMMPIKEARKAGQDDRDYRLCEYGSVAVSLGALAPLGETAFKPRRGTS